MKMLFAIFSILFVNVYAATGEEIRIGVEDDQVSVTDAGVQFTPVTLLHTAPVENTTGGLISLSEPKYYFKKVVCANEEMRDLVKRPDIKMMGVRQDTILAGVVLRISGTVVEVDDERRMYFITKDIAGDSTIAGARKGLEMTPNLFVVSCDQMYHDRRYAYRRLYGNLNGYKAEITILYVGKGEAVMLEPLTVISTD